MESTVKEQFEAAPDAPSFLHEHSYIPQIRNIQKQAPTDARQEDPNKNKTDETQDKNSQEKTPQNNQKINTPNLQQILLITFIVFILLIYRISVKRREKK